MGCCCSTEWAFAAQLENSETGAEGAKEQLTIKESSKDPLTVQAVWDKLWAAVGKDHPRLEEPEIYFNNLERTISIKQRGKDQFIKVLKPPNQPSTLDVLLYCAAARRRRNAPRSAPPPPPRDWTPEFREIDRAEEEARGAAAGGADAERERLWQLAELQEREAAARAAWHGSEQSAREHAAGLARGVFGILRAEQAGRAAAAAEEAEAVTRNQLERAEVTDRVAWEAIVLGLRDSAVQIQRRRDEAYLFELGQWADRCAAATVDCAVGHLARLASVALDAAWGTGGPGWNGAFSGIKSLLEQHRDRVEEYERHVRMLRGLLMRQLLSGAPPQRTEDALGQVPPEVRLRPDTQRVLYGLALRVYFRCRLYARRYRSRFAARQVQAFARTAQAQQIRRRRLLRLLAGQRGRDLARGVMRKAAERSRLPPTSEIILETRRAFIADPVMRQLELEYARIPDPERPPRVLERRRLVAGDPREVRKRSRQGGGEPGGGATSGGGEPVPSGGPAGGGQASGAPAEEPPGEDAGAGTGGAQGAGRGAACDAAGAAAEQQTPGAEGTGVAGGAEGAALAIQCAQRRRVARGAARTRRMEEAAAHLSDEEIHAMWSKVLAVKHGARRRVALYCRGWQRCFAWLRPRRLRAAVSISAFWRGYLGRQRAREQRLRFVSVGAEYGERRGRLFAEAAAGRRALEGQWLAEHEALCEGFNVLATLLRLLEKLVPAEVRRRAAVARSEAGCWHELCMREELARDCITTGLATRSADCMKRTAEQKAASTATQREIQALDDLLAAEAAGDTQRYARRIAALLNGTSVVHAAVNRASVAIAQSEERRKSMATVLISSPSTHAQRHPRTPGDTSPVPVTPPRAPVPATPPPQPAVPPAPQPGEPQGQRDEQQQQQQQHEEQPASTHPPRPSEAPPVLQEPEPVLQEPEPAAPLPQLPVSPPAPPRRSFVPAEEQGVMVPCKDTCYAPAPIADAVAAGGGASICLSVSSPGRAASPMRRVSVSPSAPRRSVRPPKPEEGATVFCFTPHALRELRLYAHQPATCPDAHLGGVGAQSRVGSVLSAWRDGATTFAALHTSGALTLAARDERPADDEDDGLQQWVTLRCDEWDVLWTAVTCWPGPEGEGPRCAFYSSGTGEVGIAHWSEDCSGLREDSRAIAGAGLQELSQAQCGAVDWLLIADLECYWTAKVVMLRASQDLKSIIPLCNPTPVPGEEGPVTSCRVQPSDGAPAVLSCSVRGVLVLRWDPSLAALTPVRRWVVPCTRACLAPVPAPDTTWHWHLCVSHISGACTVHPLATAALTVPVAGAGLGAGSGPLPAAAAEFTLPRMLALCPAPRRPVTAAPSGAPGRRNVVGALRRSTPQGGGEDGKAFTTATHSALLRAKKKKMSLVPSGTPVPTRSLLPDGDGDQGEESEEEDAPSAPASVPFFEVPSGSLAHAAAARRGLPPIRTAPRTAAPSALLPSDEMRADCPPSAVLDLSKPQQASRARPPTVLGRDLLSSTRDQALGRIRQGRRATPASRASRVQPDVGERVVDFRDRALSSAAALPIVAAVGSSSVMEELLLSGNALDDDFAVVLATPLRFAKALTHLDLSGNRITDAGARHLMAAVAINRRLRVVNLVGNPCSTTVQREIRDELVRHF